MKKIITLLILAVFMAIPVYADSIESFVKGYAIFEDDGLYGVVNTKGEITVEPTWEYIRRRTADLAIVVKDGKGGMINVTTGEIVVKPIWKNFKSFVGKNWIGVIDEENYFYVLDITTDKIVPKSVSHIVNYYKPAYDIGHAIMDDGRRLYTLSLEKFLIIDQKYILKYFNNGVGRIYDGDHYGLVDVDGNITAPLIWDKIHNFYSEVAIAKKDDQTYIINKDGDILLTSKWDYISDFREGKAIVRKDGLYGMIDLSGKIIIPLKWDRLQRDYNDSTSPCIGVKSKKYAYIDINTGEILADNFTYAWHHKGGIAVANKGSQRFNLNLEGKKAFESSYSTSGFDNGMGVIFGEKDGLGRVGFMDTTGKVISKPQWDGTLSYHENFAAVKKGEVWGYVPWEIWRNNNPNSIPSGAQFGEPVWELQKEGKWGFIDKEGKLITKVEFDNVENFKDGCAIVVKNDQWAIIDTTGQIIFVLDK